MDICSNGAIRVLPCDLREGFLIESSEWHQQKTGIGVPRTKRTILPGDEVCLVLETARTKSRSFDVQAVKEDGRKIDRINHGT